MTMPTPFDLVEDSLETVPRFPVEPPDGRKDVAELPRQVAFLSLMRMAGPAVEVRALPNAGKRNPTKARQEGIKAGLFDLGCWWSGGGHAVVEMKGYTKDGRAGSLSKEQIDFGNLLHRMGTPAACFFTPEKAVAWLASVGAPVRAVR